MNGMSLLKGVVVAGIFVTLSTAHAVVTIDQFTTPAAGQSVTASSSTTSNLMTATTAGSDIIGLDRVSQANYSSGSGAVTVFANFSSDGFFSQSVAPNTVGWSYVEWDGDTTLGINPTGLGGVDLTEGGAANVLKVYVVDNDKLGDLTFRVFTDADEASEYVLNIPALTVNTLFSIPYAAFSDVGLGGGPASFTSVGAISMKFVSAETGADISLNFIETGLVPEPSTALLLGAGMAGLSLIRRRRK